MIDCFKSTSHDLVRISGQISDESSELTKWSQILNCITSQAESMRYPDCWPPPKIPHTVYTADKANNAKECAEKIVKKTKKLIGIHTE